MAYIVDPINNTLIDDEKPFTKIADNLGKKKEYKQLEFDFSEKKKMSLYESLEPYHQRHKQLKSLKTDLNQ